MHCKPSYPMAPRVLCPSDFARLALFVILISVIPIYLAQRLAGDTGAPGR